MIKLIFYYYWQVCLFKESPENTPYSFFLLGLSACLLILLMVIQWQYSDRVFSEDLFLTLLAAISLILSFIVYSFVVLFFRGVRGRLVQTATCLFFTYFIVQILASSLFLLDPFLLGTDLKKPLSLFIGVIYLFITLGLSVWKFVITAHIYKYALSTSSIQSVLAAFGLLAVNILTVSFWR